MKREIWRNYPLTEKVALVEDLFDRGILDDGRRVSKQPGRCCPLGCEVPAPEAEVPDHSRFAKRDLKRERDLGEDVIPVTHIRHSAGAKRRATDGGSLLDPGDS